MAMMTYPYQGEYAERLHAEGEAKSVLWVLEGRGVPVPEGARERVMGCRDMALFDAWLLRAIEVASADEFFG
ncbi:hypothetical protein C1J01_21620 [Nonomuraea aridisoli]|uniref:Uncharacterized protein n=2 Tax=Nonomuraea aridisoli TaxID=2070368 RepID=A0A2W2EHA0_9ACTN|nr:hypothetical protein C1J01_21620 [Nonomuraea aridisoli]